MAMTLAERRRSFDMSLGECARACGLKASELSHIEWGRKQPTDEIIAVLASTLKCSPEEIRESLPKEDPKDAKRYADVFVALKAVSDDAKKHGFGKGHGGTGEIECPIDKKKLRYSIAGYNGHIWGACENLDCVRWMQ